jgi:hypothetical protein
MTNFNKNNINKNTRGLVVGGISIIIAVLYHQKTTDNLQSKLEYCKSKLSESERYKNKYYDAIQNYDYD